MEAWPLERHLQRVKAWATRALSIEWRISCIELATFGAVRLSRFLVPSMRTKLDAQGYRRGIQLFNRKEFFDAHEVWEEVWRDAEGQEKKFLQGLIQVAVAFHHHSTGNLTGTQSLLRRAAKNLADYPEQFLGIRVPDLLESLAKWQAVLPSGGSKPAFPRLDLIE
jgi:hypothetical protein